MRGKVSWLAIWMVCLALMLVLVSTVLASDTGFKEPTDTGDWHNNWTNPTNAYSNDGSYASGGTDSGDDEQDYSGFNFSIPAGATIDGIKVEVEAKTSGSNNCQLQVSLYDGSNQTSYQTVGMNQSYTVHTFGGPSDTWGTSWSVSELSNANFQVRMHFNDGGYGCGDSDISKVDYVKVKVYYTESTTVDNNPDLEPACGIDVIFVLDESYSIVNGSIADDVRDSAHAFLDALEGTGSRVAIVEFNTEARNPIGYTEVTAASVTNTFDPYLYDDPDSSASNNYYDPEDYGGSDYYTNWEAALEEVYSINTSSGVAPLVVFFTDGDPTAHINDSTGDPVIDGTSSSDIANALAEAIPDANAVKGQGSHIFVVALPNPSVDESNVQAISGPDRYPDEPDFGKADYNILSDVNDLAGALENIATELCGGTITVSKIIDHDGDVNTTGDQVTSGSEVENWTFNANVQSPGSATPSSGQTDSSGNLNFEIDSGGSGTATVDIIETIKTDYTLLSASCSGATTANGTFDGTDSVDGITMDENDVVTCTFYNTETATDFGDLPDTGSGTGAGNYKTLLSDDGPRHWAIGPMLGAARDTESDGQPTSEADGDDTNGTDDEDGVTFTTSLIPGQSASVQVTGTSGAKLDAWIDFNADGTFGSGEQIASSFNLTGGTQTINVNVPSGASTGSSYARFRVSTAGGLSPTGLANDGEVEDYRVFIGECVPNVYFETDQAGSTLTEGEFIDGTEFEGITSISTGDANHLPMVFDSTCSGGCSGNDPDLGTPNQTFGGPGVGNGGEFGKAGENSIPHGNILIRSDDNNQSSPNDWAASGTLTFIFDTPSRLDEIYFLDNEEPDSKVRVFDAGDSQIGSDIFLTNFGGDGDNSFQVVSINQTAVKKMEVVFGGSGAVPAVVFCSEKDFGDLPESGTSYPTTLSNNGARHEIGTLKLDGSIDAETDGQPDAEAGVDNSGGDDGNGIDDEDGVSLAGSKWQTGSDGGSVQVDVSGGNGCLSAWIDWNHDGDFTYTNFGSTFFDSGEVIFDNEPVTAGTQTLSFDIPAGTTINNNSFYARFRLYPVDAGGSSCTDNDTKSPSGLAIDGEVEDYLFSFDPNAITLTHLTARSASGAPAGVVWATLMLLAGSVVLGGMFVVRRRDQHT